MAQEQALARITPIRRLVEAPPASSGTMVPRRLTSREKAAIVVRLLLAEGLSVPISTLPEHLQSSLAEQIGQMRLIDRTTLASVIGDFLAELEQVGLSFPGGIEGALDMMDGHISATAASRLRRLAGASAKADPWDRLTSLPIERLLPVLADESVEVVAVTLSKLPVPRAAELLSRLPGERARRAAFAVSMTGDVDPETVRRIGAALAAQLDTQAPRAFETEPEDRVGAILNLSPAGTRDAVLEGLDADDEGFAARVRRTIFTFVHIPERLLPRDVPKVVRIVEGPVLVSALAAAGADPAEAPAAEFLLDNLSQRMAQSLREEIAARGPVKAKDADSARTAVILAIRQLEGAGELTLRRDDEDE